MAQAQSACLSGDYAKGVGILADLYVATRNENYIFNQARCFQQNGRYEEAILRFHEFERKRVDTGKGSDPRAQAHISECQALLARQRVADPSTPASATGSGPAPQGASSPPVATEGSAQPAPATTLPAAGPVPADTDTNRADLVQSAPAASQEQTEGSIFRRWWFWTAAGAIVVGGVATALLLSRGESRKMTCSECADAVEVNL